MAFEKRSNLGRLTREVLPKEHVYDVDLFSGKPTLAVRTCKSCLLTLDPNMFYVEGKGKAKRKHQLRSICINCWDIAKGKNIRSIDKDESATLDDFL